MKRTLVMFSLAAMLLGVSFVARADLNGFLKDVNIQAQADMKNFSVRLSKQFGVSEPDVQLIIKAVSKPADAFMILQIGQMAHADHMAVLQKYQHNQGKGWGRLAQDMGIKPGSAEFHALKRGNLTFTGERSEDRMERDDGPGRGHGNGKSHGRGHGKD